MLTNLIANEKKREKRLREEIREEIITQEKTETAKRLFNMGLSAEAVVEGSELSMEEVEKILSSLTS